MIERGLVIEGKWLAKILAGEKTREIRPKRNNRTRRQTRAEHTPKESPPPPRLAN